MALTISGSSIPSGASYTGTETLKYKPPYTYVDGVPILETSKTYEASFSKYGFTRHLYANRSDSVKRKKPVGIELMFNPTNHSGHIVESQDSMVVATAKAYYNTPLYHQYIEETIHGSYSEFCQNFYKNRGPVRNYWESTGAYVTLRSPHGFSVNRQPMWAYDFSLNQNKLLLKIKAEKMNVGMLILEWKQTQEMYIQAAKALLDTYRGIRKGKLGHLLYKGIKSAPDTWLLYRYGVTPHLADIKAGIDIATVGLKRKPLYQRFSATSTLVDKAGSHTWRVGDATFTENGRERLVVTDIAFVEYESGEILSNLTRLGLSNPALLAWEVIPFSFVVDWFIDVGDTLSALDALTGVKRHASTRTEKLIYNVYGPNGMYLNEMEYNRRVQTLNNVQTPRWNPSLNWKRLTDIPALLKGIMKR